MNEEDLSKRLAGLELAVAHLTEALEELAKVVDPSSRPSRSLISSHLHDIRENFNRVVP
jgi:uncharacterized coiled-coil protein SlyX